MVVLLVLKELRNAPPVLYGLSVTYPCSDDSTHRLLVELMYCYTDCVDQVTTCLHLAELK